MLNPALLNNGSTDNCSPTLSFAASKTHFDCTDFLTLTFVTLTVTDVAGNSSTCETLVKISDTIPTTAICVESLKLELDPFGNPITLDPSDLDNGSFDNCAQIVSFHADKTVFDCSDWGLNMVTLTVEDSHSDVGTCTTIVKIQDVSAPIVICDELFVVGLDEMGTASLSPLDLDEGSWDGCSGINLARSLDKTDFYCSDLGTTQAITLTVSDEYGNSNACITEVSIIDKIDPVTVCLSSTTLALNEDGLAILDAEDLNDGSYDNCTVDLVYTANRDTFNCEDLGSHMVTLTVEDGSGNTQMCLVEVLVTDKMDPIAQCADSLVLVLDDTGLTTLFSTLVDAGSYDNCGIMSSEPMPNQLSASNLGSNMVVLTVTDASGNTSECSTMVELTQTISGLHTPRDIAAVLPNPSEGIFELRMGKGLSCDRAEVFNTSGQLVWSANKATDVLKIDLSAQASGLYCLRVQSGDAAQTIQLTLSH